MFLPLILPAFESSRRRFLFSFFVLIWFCIRRFCQGCCGFKLLSFLVYLSSNVSSVFSCSFPHWVLIPSNLSFFSLSSFNFAQGSFFLQILLSNLYSLVFSFKAFNISSFKLLVKGLFPSNSCSFSLSSFKQLLCGLFPSNLSIFRPSRFDSRVFFLQPFLPSIFRPSSLSSGVFLPSNLSSFNMSSCKQLLSGLSSLKLLFLQIFRPSKSY